MCTQDFEYLENRHLCLIYVINVMHQTRVATYTIGIK